MLLPLSISKSRRVKEEDDDEDEDALDKDISQLLEPASPASSMLSSLADDSIMGPADSEEEEEDEVNGLLVED